MPFTKISTPPKETKKERQTKRGIGKGSVTGRGRGRGKENECARREIYRNAGKSKPPL